MKLVAGSGDCWVHMVYSLHPVYMSQSYDPQPKPSQAPLRNCPAEDPQSGRALTAAFMGRFKVRPNFCMIHFLNS